MVEKIKNQSISLIIGVSIFCLLIVLAVFAWTGPSGVPPGSNAPAPINVSIFGQEKEGQLGISIPSGEFLDGSYGLTVGTASNPLGIKSSGDSYFGQDLTAMGNITTSGNVETNQVQSWSGSDLTLWAPGGMVGSADIYITPGIIGGAYQDVIMAENGGRVGIGTPTPTYTLDMRADSSLSVNDGYLRNTRALYLKDWDDDTGGSDNKYRLLGRDGAWMFYNGGVVVGNYSNGTWSDVADGNLIVEGNANMGSATIGWGGLTMNGSIDANQNYIYGQRCCWNVVVDAIGGFSNTPKGYCWDALGPYYSPVAVSCQNVQEVTALPNACNSSGDDHCYFFSMEAGVANVCDYSTGGDAVISCCKTRGICGETP